MARPLPTTLSPANGSQFSHEILFLYVRRQRKNQQRYGRRKQPLATPNHDGRSHRRLSRIASSS